MNYPKPLELLERLSSRDIALWQAYDNLFPFGQYHTDYLLAQLTAVTFNMLKAGDTEPLTVDEVLGIAEPLTEEYVKATIRNFNNGIN